MVQRRELFTLGLGAAAVLAARPAAAQTVTPGLVVERGQVLRRGALVTVNNGLSTHEVRGRVTILLHDNKQYLHLGDDFFFDGSPDPYLGFGLRRAYNNDTTFSPLNFNEGAQVYRLPAKIDLQRLDVFFLWCQAFGVALARAPLANA